MKQCSKCKITKDTSEFYPIVGNPDGLDYSCKDCIRQRNRDAYWSKRADQHERTAARQWQNRLRREYGITVEDYDAMLLAQGGVCAVCGLNERPRAGRVHRLCVDHDHATGRVRGLLCKECNRAEGHLQGDPNRALALAAYMIQHEEVPAWSE